MCLFIIVLCEDTKSYIIKQFSLKLLNFAKCMLTKWNPPPTEKGRLNNGEVTNVRSARISVCVSLGLTLEGAAEDHGHMWRMYLSSENKVRIKLKVKRPCPSAVRGRCGLRIIYISSSVTATPVNSPSWCRCRRSRWSWSRGSQTGHESWSRRP